jgi:hypothetical protein
MAIQEKNWIAIEITITLRGFKHCGEAFPSFMVSCGKRGKVIDRIAAEIENHIAVPIVRAKHPVHIFPFLQVTLFIPLEFG